MGVVRVTFPDGRIVEGVFRTQCEGHYSGPVLIAGGELFSGLDAISQGLSVHPISDPVIDNWLNTFQSAG